VVRRRVTGGRSKRKRKSKIWKMIKSESRSKSRIQLPTYIILLI
jgi:hypothetical protein